MSLPTHEMLLTPVLQLLEDRELHSCKYIFEKIAEKFELTEEEKYRLNPGKYKYIYSNRLEWAVSILEEIEYLVSPIKDQCKITKQGLVNLKAKTSSDEILALKPQYYCDFLFSYHELLNCEPGGVIGLASNETCLKNTYDQINNTLSEKLLESIQKNTPQFFERLILKLLVAMGYGDDVSHSSTAAKISHDEGIDGVINRDRLGLDKIYVQAKRWEKVVGRPEIQKFVGALHGKGAVKGIFVTTSSFTSFATNYIKSLALNVVLIDGEYLTQLMIEHNIGVYTKAKFEVKALNADFFTYE